ncbi:hypothetical protein J2847_001268 [Azospirillum agricola]|nr:hypothetical protein [Azospirillum agricola]
MDALSWCPVPYGRRIGLPTLLASLPGVWPLESQRRVVNDAKPSGSLSTIA